MKRFLTISLFLVVIPVSVFAADVKSDYDRDVNLPDLHTYRFANQLAGSELTDKRMRNAFRDSFAAIGLYETEGRVDVVVEYYAGVQQKKRVRTSGYGRPWFGGMQTATVEDYTDGTAMVDFVDARTGELIWRGTVSGNVTLSNADKRTKDGMERLAKQFRKDREKQAKASW